MATMNIDILLKKYNLNQKDLAESTGINKNTVSRYCNGTFEKVDKNHIDLICKYFKCTPNDIFKLDDTVEVIPAKIQYYDSETDVIAEGEIKPPSNAFKRRATWSYSNSKKFNIPIPTLRTDIEIPEAVQQEYNKWMKGFILQHNLQEKVNNENTPTNNKDSFEIEQIQKRLDLEYSLELNLESILDIEISNSDLTSLPIRIRKEIEAFSEQKATSFQFKFILAYRSLFTLIVSQSNNKQLIEFMSRMIKIYNNGGLYELTDNELNILITESNILLDKYIIKKD
jgi:putative transcriptional regulator